MNYQPITNAIGNAELISAIMQHVNNQRKVSKFSIAYMIGMMDSQKGLYADNLKRADVVAMFERLINTDKIARLNNGYCLTEVFKQFSK